MTILFSCLFGANASVAISSQLALKFGMLEITDDKKMAKGTICMKENRQKLHAKNGRFWEANKWLVKVNDYLLGSVGMSKTHPFFIWP